MTSATARSTSTTRFCRSPRVTPDAAALITSHVALENGLFVLPPDGVLVHTAAHLFADGDLQGGLRNLWDIHCLMDEFGSAQFDAALTVCALQHGLAVEMARALFGDGADLTLIDRSTAPTHAAC